VRPLISAALGRFAGPAGDAGDAELTAAVGRASASAFDWALQAGLGPLLHQALANSQPPLAPELAARLLAADLTARVVTQERVAAALDAIDACNRRGIPVTLLKGISLSHRHYPAPHFRPMTDADLLVPAAALDVLAADLLQQGYWREGIVVDPGLQHAEPLYHPISSTRVELHSRLFPLWSPLQQSTSFDADAIARESAPASFHGRPVSRLSPEFQLVYLAASWNRDLSGQALHPSFVFGLFDAVALMQAPFDWNLVLDIADSPPAAASLDVLLACLGREGVDVPSHVRSSLRRRHGVLGASEVAVLASLVSGYLIRGKPFRYFNSARVWTPLLGASDRPGVKALKIPWYVAFPPGEPRRYELSYQWERIRRWGTRFSQPEP
jgi:hypothetical protein